MVEVTRGRRKASDKKYKCLSQLGMLGCSVTHPSAGIKPLLKVLSGDRKHTNGMNGHRIRVKVESFSGPL